MGTSAIAKTPDSSECAGLLYKLEILDTLPTQETENQGITRAEFAVMIGRARGLSDIKIKERYFIEYIKE